MVSDRYRKRGAKIDSWRERAYKKRRKHWTVGLAYEGWIGDNEDEVRKLHGHRWVTETSSTIPMV